MMTSRQRLEDEASGVHEQVDAMLDSEDSIIILMDARRAINYVRGFGLSACQLELLATDIERLVRTVTRTQPSRKEKKRYDQGTGMDVGLSTVVALILASVAGVWLTNDLRVVGLVIVGITPIAAGLVGYFEWRANLLRKALAEQQHHRRDHRPNPVGRVPQNAVREKTVT